MPSEYCVKGGELPVTEDMKNEFNETGCVLVRGLLTAEEIAMVKKSLESKIFREYMYGVDDTEGGKAHMCIWNQPGSDVTGMVARCQKMAGTCEQLMDGEVYHYHSKLMGKPPKEGGKHLWHQDYGYWYENGCIFPNMLTVFIAIDECEKKNGCLQYLPGSQQCGRVEHHRAGGQFEADLDRVREAEKFFPKQYAELKPGDALFMHCNVLHCSSANKSDIRRWALLCCYNKADNNPFIEHHHPQYSPLTKVGNDAILTCTKEPDPREKAFMPLGVDKTSLLEDVKK